MLQRYIFDVLDGTVVANQEDADEVQEIEMYKQDFKFCYSSLLQNILRSLDLAGGTVMCTPENVDEVMRLVTLSFELGGYPGLNASFPKQHWAACEDDVLQAKAKTIKNLLKLIKFYQNALVNDAGQWVCLTLFHFIAMETPVPLDVHVALQILGSERSLLRASCMSQRQFDGLRPLENAIINDVEPFFQFLTHADVTLIEHALQSSVNLLAILANTAEK